MVTISSPRTKFYKYVFPVLWVGFVLVFAVMGATIGVPRHDLMLLFPPVFMLLIGALLFRKLLWPLADEVQDHGDYLLVKNRGWEETVYLTNIMNVSMSSNTNPPMLSLRLVKPGRFGDQIVFTPASQGFSWNPFRRNQIAEDLMVRVDKARSRRTN